MKAQRDTVEAYVHTLKHGTPHEAEALWMWTMDSEELEPKYLEACKIVDDERIVALAHILKDLAPYNAEARWGCGDHDEKAVLKVSIPSTEDDGFTHFRNTARHISIGLILGQWSQAYWYGVDLVMGRFSMGFRAPVETP